MNNCKIRTDNFPMYLFYKKKKFLEAVFFLERSSRREVNSIRKLLIGVSRSCISPNGLWLSLLWKLFQFCSLKCYRNVKPSNEHENANYKSRNSSYNFKNEKKGRQFLLTLQCEIFQCCHDSQTTNYNCKLQNKCYTEWKLQNFYIS